MKWTLLILMLLLPVSTIAVDGTWTNNASGNWSAAGSWSNSIVADGTDGMAYLANRISTARTISNDTARTIGSIYAQDTGENYTIGGTNVLSIDVSSGLPTLSALPGRTLTVTCPVDLYDGFYSTGTVVFTCPVRLQGNQTWTNDVGSYTFGTVPNTIDLNGYTLTLSGTAAANSIGGASGTNRTFVGTGNLIKNSTGRLTLGGISETNSLVGGTVTFAGGTTLLNNDNNILRNANMVLNGGVIVWYWGTTFTKTLGTGTNQIQVLGGESGFGQNGSAVTINLGTTVTWGSSYFNPSVLVLGDNAVVNNPSLTFQSRLDLNGATRTIRVRTPANYPTYDPIMQLQGAITNSTGTAGLIKTGPGTLSLLASPNTINGLVEVRDGKLIHNNTGWLGISGMTVSNGAIAIFQGFSAASQNFNVSGDGTWLKTASGGLTVHGTNTVASSVVSNGVMTLTTPLAFSSPTVTLYGSSTVLINTNNVVHDNSQVYIQTGGGGASIPKIQFQPPAGKREDIARLYIDGVLQPRGTYGATGSGAQYINDDVFSTTNGVINVLGEFAVVINGKVLQVGGKTVTIPRR